MGQGAKCVGPWSSVHRNVSELCSAPRLRAGWAGEDARASPAAPDGSRFAALLFPTTDGASVLVHWTD